MAPCSSWTAIYTSDMLQADWAERDEKYQIPDETEIWETAALLLSSIADDVQFNHSWIRPVES